MNKGKFVSTKSINGQVNDPTPIPPISLTKKPTLRLNAGKPTLRMTYKKPPIGATNPNYFA